MNTAFRASTRQVHRWTGLTIGLLVVFLAITGLGLVFRAQLEAVAAPELHRVSGCSSALPLDVLVTRARLAHPGSDLDDIVIPAGSEVRVVRFSDKIAVFVDPCNGAVLGQRHRWGGLMNTVEQLHRFRFLGNTDMANFFTGSAAFATVFIFVAGGLVVWWPATLQAFRRSLKPRLHLKGRALDLNLHQTVGLYASLVLLMVALTALPIAFKWVRHAVNSATGTVMSEARPASKRPSAEAQCLPLETLWQSARTLMPEPKQATLKYPSSDRDPVEFQLLGRDAPHAEALTMLYIDAYSANVLKFEPYALSRVGNKVLVWASALHRGLVGGIFGQSLLFMGVLGVPVLGYTGISSYLRRRRGARPA